MSSVPLALGFGLAIGLSVGALGGGGSILAVPVLVYVLGQGVHEATTAALLVVAAGAFAGVIQHSKGGWVCWRHAGAFAACSLPGAVVGTYLANGVSGDGLILAFATIMLAVAGMMWLKSGRKTGATADPGAQVERGCPPLDLWRDGGAGLAIGLLTGFFGVGGGFLIVPALVILLAFPVRTAIGTSLAVIAAAALIGLAAHLALGRSMDFELAGVMAVACAGGAVGGAAIADRVPQQVLGHGFAAVVALVAIYLVVSVAFLGGPPAT